MFGSFIHDLEMTNSEAVARSIPTFSLQHLNPGLFEGLPERAALAAALTGKHIWADQSADQLQFWAFGVQVGSFSFSCAGCSIILFTLNHGALNFKTNSSF